MCAQPVDCSLDAGVGDMTLRITYLYEHQVGLARQPTIEAVAQSAIAGGDGAGHQAVPLPGGGGVPARPTRCLVRVESANIERLLAGVDPGADTIARDHQVGMRIEARVEQRDRDATASKAR